MLVLQASVYLQGFTGAFQASAMFSRWFLLPWNPRGLLIQSKGNIDISPLERKTRNWVLSGSLSAFISSHHRRNERLRHKKSKSFSPGGGRAQWEKSLLTGRTGLRARKVTRACGWEVGRRLQAGLPDTPLWEERGGCLVLVPRRLLPEELGCSQERHAR